jgi:hypothetical protein
VSLHVKYARWLLQPPDPNHRPILRAPATTTTHRLVNHDLVAVPPTPLWQFEKGLVIKRGWRLVRVVDAELQVLDLHGHV